MEEGHFNSISDLEIKWNPFSLPNKTLYSIKNSRLAEEYLVLGFFETKHPDFRVRCVFDHSTSTVEIGSRVGVYAEEVKRVLRTFGLKKITWKQNTNLNKMCEKQYPKAA